MFQARGAWRGGAGGNVTHAPPSKRKTTPKLKARSDGRIGLHTAESRARHRWVAAEALALLLERYATHLTRGCTSDRRVDNSVTRVCADSLTCPVCTRLGWLIRL